MPSLYEVYSKPTLIRSTRTSQVRLKEYGSELIEVADNGAGIAPEDYSALTLKYHTSKLQNFSDLQVPPSLDYQLCCWLDQQDTRQ